MSNPTIIITGASTIYSDLPLNPTSRSIRLLFFWRDDFGRNICGRLERFQTTRCPPFMALSYAWGNAQPEYSILLHGKRFKIRENLFNALQHVLNHLDEIRASTSIPSRDHLVDDSGHPLNYIWIDSVCINQEDIAERNHQVSMMKDIYSAATLVLAWAGNSSNITQKSMQFFRDCRRSGPSSLRYLSQMLALGGLRSDKGIRHLLYQFFELQYFHRMWIVQELILAQRVVFMCGPDAIDGNVIDACISDYSISITNNKGFLETAGGQIMASKGDLTDELGFLICRFWDRECSDRRDKVYALLGMAKQHSSEVASLRDSLLGMSPGDTGDLSFVRYVSPDYELSPFELYLKLINCAIFNSDVPTSFEKAERIPVLEDYGIAALRKMLDIPGDLIVPFDRDEQGVNDGPYAEDRVEWRPTLVRKTMRFAIGKKRTKGDASKCFLSQVRSLNWSKPESWSQNYRTLYQWTSSYPNSFVMTLQDLEKYWDIEEWAAETLGLPAIVAVEDSSRSRRDVRKAVFRQLLDCKTIR